MNHSTVHALFLSRRPSEHLMDMPVAYSLRSNSHTREFKSRAFCSTLLEMVFPMLDHLWTQYSLTFDLTVDHTVGPYIEQMKSTPRI